MSLQVEVAPGRQMRGGGERPVEMSLSAVAAAAASAKISEVK